jgi:DNA-binding beta-propeller fold protein YncE
VTQNPAVAGSITGIASFQVASDGKLAPIGNTAVASPVALAMDSAGKFLFVASGSAGTVSVFSVGSNASLTLVGTTSLPLQGSAQAPPTASALAVTYTAYPFQYSYCAGNTPPTTENLYVTDSANYVVLSYAVSSTGDLTLVSPGAGITGVATGSVPSGLAVDPCNRFAFISNGSPNNSISAFTICNAITPNCQYVDYSLHPVAGSPFPISPGENPGPLAVDAYGAFLYVVEVGSGGVAGFRIGASTGGLSSIGTYAAGAGANSIAIRSDDSWLFVANSSASTLSQYAITISNGVLLAQPVTTTFNIPTGVAVK